MYINLYPSKHLQATKKTMRLTGAFLTAGGSYALLREFFWQPDFRACWAVASGVLVLLGLFLLAVATDRIMLRDAYLSITPERIMYRLSLTGHEKLLLWDGIKGMQVTEHYVLFEQEQKAPVKLRLGLIQQPEIAQHVSRSLLLAALEKGIPVNGVEALPKKPPIQA